MKSYKTWSFMEINAVRAKQMSRYQDMEYFII